MWGILCSRSSEEEQLSWEEGSQEAEDVDMGLKEWTQLSVRGWKKTFLVDERCDLAGLSGVYENCREGAGNYQKCGLKPDSRRKLRHLDFILVVMKR